MLPTQRWSRQPLRARVAPTLGSELMNTLSGNTLDLFPVSILESFGMPFLLFRPRDSAVLPSSAMRGLLDHSELQDVSDRLVQCMGDEGGFSNRSTGDNVFLTPWRSHQLRAKSVSTRDGRMWVVVLSANWEKGASASTSLPTLTGRERSVARLIAFGESNKRIAAALEISEHTARHHTERVFAKLGVRTRSAVAAVIARSADR